MRRTLCVALAMMWLGATACGSSGNTTDTDAGSDSGDASTTKDGAAPDGGVCCPADPNPGCCMNYGGWSSDGTTCVQTCDGMPQPNDPEWSLGPDSHGCPVWSNPKPNGGPGTCGAATLDSGTDSGSDASDASGDATAD